MNVTHLQNFPAAALVALLSLSNVAIADNHKQAQQELSAQPTKLIGEVIELREVGDTEESDDALSIAIVQAFPKANEGKYVAIFNELTHQWAARRNASAQ